MVYLDDLLKKKGVYRFKAFCNKRGAELLVNSMESWRQSAFHCELGSSKSNEASELSHLTYNLLKVAIETRKISVIGTGR